MIGQLLWRQFVAVSHGLARVRTLRWAAVAIIWLATHHAAASDALRVATFNLSLYGEQAGQVLARLQSRDDPQAKHLAEIIQRVHPDVLLLNEIDYDAGANVLNAFHDNYLAVGQNVSQSPGGPAEPLEFPYRYTAAVNTGVHSGFDLNRDGTVDPNSGSDAYAADGWGYGRYPGQYGIAILSKHPIDAAAVRTFQNFLWKDMPDARLPDDPTTPAPADWFPAEAVAKFPLSSKSHWDVPITVDGRRIHLLASHPTPPVYDGPEDRNGRRNHDEIRFWVDYVGPAAGSSYIYDDKGNRSGLGAGENLIILGDLNGDPNDGDGKEGIGKLLAAPAILHYPAPASEGAAEQARLQGGANLRHRGDPANDTCDPADNPGPGNLRLDYLLPSRDLRVVASGVFWPLASDPLFKLVGVHPFPASDHRLVWIDLELPPPESPSPGKD